MRLTPAQNIFCCGPAKGAIGGIFPIGEGGPEGDALLTICRKLKEVVGTKVQVGIGPPDLMQYNSCNS